MGGPADNEEQYWMDRLQRLGVGPGEFRELQRECSKATAPDVSLHDAVWNILHVLEEEAFKGLQQKDWDSARECVCTVQDIRLEMVWLVSMEGKDPTQHLVNMVRSVKAAVRVFGARSDVCKYGGAGLALSYR